MTEIDSLNKLNAFLRADLRRKHSDDRMPIWKGYLKFPTFRLMFWLRVCQYLKRTKNLLYSPAYLFLNHYKVKYGVDIPVSYPIEPGLDLVHGGSVYIKAEWMGKNVTIYQNVTVGSGADGASGFPVIEDDVVIYTGAVISGPVTLHRGCRIGANSVVTRDVPPDTLVAGAPARVIRTLNNKQPGGSQS